MCGLHSLYLPQMRQVLDLKIYLDTDETLRRYWKSARDRADRGHTAGETAAQIERRQGDAEKYIYPQKQYADLVIRYFDTALSGCRTESDGDYRVSLGVEFLMDVGINIEPMLGLLQEQGISGNLVYDRDLLHQRMVFDGADLKKTGGAVWEQIARAAIPQMEDLAGGRIIWEDGTNGLVQVILLMVIGEIMKRD